ncbi:hypothetical protein BG006_009776 [Podila minutissima]|uniref:Crinkler effector protein N-terminal domain-containing protein n=1 Tax=Podila minutissima TaxID=64525 RepID=A0A9P5VPX4_9FUNG|nr:hypothetical protein BG006_009776 [Podila minutissima]
MADNRVSLYCLVDGDLISKALALAIPSTETVGQLRATIYLCTPVWFKDLGAEDLTLWRVSIPAKDVDKLGPIVLNDLESATELDPTDDDSDIFEEKPPKKTIRIIVQRPSPGLPLPLTDAIQYSNSASAFPHPSLKFLDEVYGIQAEHQK